jgi:riboflavin kinase/FMN adenylyltransferase|tara:strand:- start:2150 stop:3145 length:996 start_codon:yes stop_codon:yes gene_type:complete
VKVLHGFTDVDLQGAGSVVSIGNFDGVHIGHQAVIGSAVQSSFENGLMSVVCTFDPHTRVFLQPDAPPQLLETFDQRLRAIAALGVDIAVVIPFSKVVAEFPRDRFINEFLVATLGTAELYVSEGFTFGAGGAGDVEYLKKAAPGNEFKVRVVGAVMADSKPVSSTRVRDAVTEGRVSDATELLGRPFAIAGEVIAGTGRGRSLNAPTANLNVENTFVPGHGVYVTEARFAGRSYKAVSNVGTRPTFGPSGELTVETHLLDCEIELCGEQLELAFLERLRDEIKFESPDALAIQIAEDVRQALNYVTINKENVRYTADVSSDVRVGEDSGA